jgi:hypothetical protein
MDRPELRWRLRAQLAAQQVLEKKLGLNEASDN